MVEGFQYFFSKAAGKCGPCLFADAQLIPSNGLQGVQPDPLVINYSQLLLDVLIDFFMGMEFLIECKARSARGIPQLLGRDS
ncbi:hypothetical protein D3C80_2056630 [compost metagenome]